MKMMGLFLLLPLVTNAQSGLSPEAQSAYDDATRDMYSAGEAQIRQYENQSRESYRNINKTLLDQQIQQLANQQQQQIEYQRQQTEYQRQLLEQQRRQQEIGAQNYQQQNYVYEQPPPDYAGSQQEVQQVESDTFVKGLADLNISDFNGNLPPPPAIQQPSSLDLLREAGLTNDVRPRVDLADQLMRITQESQRRQAETNRFLIDALVKQGCIAFKTGVGGTLPECATWNPTSQTPPGESGSVVAGLASSVATSSPSSTARGQYSNTSVRANSFQEYSPWLVILGFFGGLMAMIFIIAREQPETQIPSE